MMISSGLGWDRALVDEEQRATEVRGRRTGGERVGEHQPVGHVGRVHAGAEGRLGDLGRGREPVQAGLASNGPERAERRLDVVRHDAGAPGDDDLVGVEAGQLGGRLGRNRVLVDEQHRTVEVGRRRSGGERVGEPEPVHDVDGVHAGAERGLGDFRSRGEPVGSGLSGHRSGRVGIERRLDGGRHDAGAAGNDDLVGVEPGELIGRLAGDRVRVDEQDRAIQEGGGRAGGQRVGEAEPVHDVHGVHAGTERGLGDLGGGREAIRAGLAGHLAGGTEDGRRQGGNEQKPDKDRNQAGRRPRRSPTARGTTAVGHDAPL
jgi:hypothetical protein